jgi:hypothetical protein
MYSATTGKANSTDAPGLSGSSVTMAAGPAGAMTTLTRQRVPPSGQGKSKLLSIMDGTCLDRSALLGPLSPDL